MDDVKLKQPLLNVSRTRQFTLYYHFLMLGAGLMVAASTVFAALDWIRYKFPETNAGAMLTFAVCAPNVLFQPITMHLGHRCSFNFKIVGSFLGMGVLLAAIPVSVEFALYSLLIAIVALIGAFNAVSQVAVFGLAGTMPERYTSAVMAGNSFGGIAITAARMACLAALGDDSSSLHISTTVYFSLAGVILLLCVFSQYSVMRDGLVVYCVAASCEKVKGRSTFSSVLPHIRGFVVLAFATFLITYAVYPTVTIATASA